MTNTEIKKAYTQTKKALEKRTGEKHTWVMNARQMKLGTGTVCTAYVHDYAERLRRAQASVEGFEAFWAERMTDYQKRAREEARKNERTPGWYFGKNNTFWQNVIANTEKLEADKAAELASRKAAVEDYTKLLAERGDFHKLLAEEVQKAKVTINGPEIQSFLAKIGGQAEVEIHENGGKSYVHGAEVYIRFHYTADAE